MINVFAYFFFDFKPKPKPIPTIKNVFFFENFLILSKLINFTFYLTRTQCSVNIHSHHTLTYLFFLMYKTNLRDLYFTINRYHLPQEKQNIVQTLLRSVFWNFTLNITQQSYNSEIISLSTLYTGFVWLERELKEISHLQIVGLKDSRRLLSDYGQMQVIDGNHYYDLLSQHVI